MLIEAESLYRGKFLITTDAHIQLHLFELDASVIVRARNRAGQKRLTRRHAHRVARAKPLEMIGWSWRLFSCSHFGSAAVVSSLPPVHCNFWRASANSSPISVCGDVCTFLTRHAQCLLGTHTILWWKTCTMLIGYPYHRSIGEMHGAWAISPC